ncbi:MAG TPA: VOC family protein [Methylomirabilota bacterium]|nr:VOC family protein [Methylomirabilota bacterium]
MPGKRKPVRPASELNLNHAMVYSRDVAASLPFYAERLGCKLIEEFKHEGRTVYARLRSPKGSSTLALHQLEPGQELHAGGVRLYFEVKDLDRFCARLEAAGVQFTQKPKLMPWGWRHAYLNDPDGHEVSIYWAGPKRFRPTRFKR